MNLSPPLSPDEAARLSSLRALEVLDSDPEPVFDSIARMASEVCGTPIALLSLVDMERTWFKAGVGLPGVRETPRDVAFCAHAIKGDGVFEVPDTRLDARFAGNPWVAASPALRFYAAAPLVLPHGERIGTLCVMDHQPRQLSPAQMQSLQSLATIASQALTMRRDLIGSARTARSEPDVAHIEREAVRARMAAVLDGGEADVSEHRMVSTDGSERWITWTHRRRLDAEGEDLLHSVGRDVTERKRVELALRASQAFLERSGRIARVGGWELNLTQGALTWSAETCRIHDVAPDHIPTLEQAISFYVPEARSTIEAAVHRCIQTGEPWDLELPLITATGREIWVRSQGEAELEHGVPARLVGAVQDITERRTLQQRLTDNEHFMREVTDALPVRIAYVDKERRYRFVNLAHCHRFGRDRAQIIGRTRAELSHESTHAEVEPRITAVLAGQPQRFEYVDVVGGQPRRVESQLIPDIDEHGAVRGFFATGIDITERTATEQALRALTAIFDNTTDFVVQSDWRGTLTYMNPAARRTAGLSLDEPVTHRNYAEFYAPENHRHYLEVILPAAKAHGVWLGETTVQAGQEKRISVSHMLIAHRDPTGRIDRYSSVMRDVSAEANAKQEAQRQTAVLRSVTEAIPSMVAVVGADFRYRFVNGAFERWFGKPREQIVGRTVQELLGPAQWERVRPWSLRALAGETVAFDRDDSTRGLTRHLAVSCTPLPSENGHIEGFVSVGQDITHHRREASRLLQMAHSDPLTGLLNRGGFQAHLQRRLDEGSGSHLALLCIDLDHFKPVNDRHGHPVGDQVLQLFAQRLRGLVRPTDAVARLGGDEFAVVLAGVREGTHARAVADKVIAAAKAPFEVGSLLVRIGASVGVALSTESAAGWDELLSRADAMLYQAKDAGRGRHAGA